MKKRRNLLCFVLALVAAVLLCCGLAACADEGDFVPTERNGIKVTFELEGAKYRNSERAVREYFTYPEGAPHKIVPLEALGGNKSKPVYPKHRLRGWFKTREVLADGTVVYSDEWNFDTDVVEGDSLVLYAKWVRAFTYTVTYLDDAGEPHDVKELIMEDDKLRDGTAVFTPLVQSDFASAYDGHTVDCELGEDGNVQVKYYSDKACTMRWDFSASHPGNPDDPDHSITDVPVYVRFNKGVYTYAATAKDLVAASAATNKGGIWLLKDIDMSSYKGTLVDGSAGAFYGFRNAGGLRGNGFTVSGIILEVASDNNSLIYDTAQGWDKVLLVSLFDGLENGSIEDVTIEDLSITLSTTNSRISEVHVSPFLGRAKNTKVSNVTVTGACVLERLPSAIRNDESKIIQATQPFYADRASTFDNVTVTVEIRKNF